MSSQRAILKRYSLILERLESGSYPSKEQLQEYLLDQGLQDSDRTVERDLAVLRDEFGLNIQYNRKQRGYAYFASDNDRLAAVFLRFLEVARTTELLESSIKEGKKSLSYISFEYMASLKGVDQLGLLLKAVKEHHPIRFLHNNFRKGTTKEKYVHPYMLREYQGRWYVIGTVDDHSTIRTFGIDRISDLEVTAQKFQADDSLKIPERFEHIIGLVYDDSEPEQIEIHVEEYQAQYFKTLPLHHSQTLIPMGDHFRLRLQIIPNFEFMQKLMMHHPQIKVVKPEWLVREICSLLQSSLDQYS